MSFPPIRRPALAAFAAFVALAALFFWPLWAPGADRMVIGAADGDFLRQFYPYRAFVAEAWAGGHLPTWNPHLYGGTPGWADPQQAVVYPWRLLQVPLALGSGTLPLWAVEFEAIAHVALGGWLVYWLLRRLGAAPIAAFAGGCVFAFGGYLTGYPVEQLAVLDTAVWIAATAAALVTAVEAVAIGDRRRAARWAVVAAAATALSALAGHPQTAVYGLYFALAWLGWLWWSRRPDGRGTVLVVGLWAVLAAGLAAIQWAPSADLLSRADRELAADELAAGLAPGAILQLAVAPEQRTSDADPGGVVAARQIVWAPLFVGGVALLLALYGGLHSRDARYLLVLAAVAFLLALGGHGPLHAPAARIVPGVALFRHQERFAVLVAVALATSSGLGLDRAMRVGPEAYRRLGRIAFLAAGAAALVAAFLVVGGGSSAGLSADGLASAALFLGLGAAVLAYGGSGRPSAGVTASAVTAIVLLEIFSAGRGRGLTPAGNPYVPDEVTAALQERARDGRVASEGLLPGGPNAAAVFGLQDITGDVVLRPATVSRLESMPEMVRWRLLATRYALSARPFPDDAPVAPILTEGDRTLYEVLLPAPFAWVAPGATAMTPLALDAWSPPPGFDPLRDPAPLPAPNGGPTLDPRGPAGGGSGQEAGEARLTGLDPGRAVVEARLAAPGQLVLSTTYDPGWRVRVAPLAAAPQGAGDASGLAEATGSGGPDEPAPPAPSPAVVPAYGVLPSIALPAGAWRVEWTYRPWALHLGAALSGAALLLGGYVWRRSRTHPA